MLRKFNTESYKGIAIKVTEKILAGRKWVVGSLILKGKTYQLKGFNKQNVVLKAKQIIDKILG